MFNYAVIENNIVSNIIIADTKEIAEEVTQRTCVKIDEQVRVDIGYKYDGINFISPIVEEQVDQPVEELVEEPTE
jgi:hypothetical protein